MLLVGAGTALGLALIGIQQWVALGVLAGVMSFIPNFGPIGALIPSIAVAIIQAPQYLFVVVLIIYGISFIQSQVVGPILASENMNLAPVLILIGQIVFGLFFGFLGIMLAVPLTAITVVLIEEIYIKDILGDTPDNKPKHDEPSLSTGEPVAETD
jgi:predicted PurR-regulated permease PerM